MDLEENLLSDELDSEIIMHREVHFGGSFELMLDYYLGSGKGIQDHFDVRRIEFLKMWEETNGENLAPLLLTGSEAEEIARAKKAYKELRDLYLKKEGTHLLIADLILTEDEEAEAEVAAIVKEGKKMTSPLIDLLKSEPFYSPLYPGYGHAPFLAAKCLGKLGDEHVALLLFEMLEEGTFSDETMVMRALEAVGDSAKKLLLRQLLRTPSDTLSTRAALALSNFPGDEEVERAALEVLRRPETRQNEILASYLVLLFEQATPALQKEFIALSKEVWPKSVQEDFSLIQRSWK